MIRTARVEDAKEILQIYSYYVKNTAITFEYDVPIEEEMKERIKNTLKKYPYVVNEEKGKVTGYAYAGTFKGRRAYDWSVEASIYVAKEERRAGTGKRLYQALEEKLALQNIENMYACIAYPIEEDEYLTKNSVEFHEHLGYKLVGRFHKCAYKFDRWYDMVWMEKFLGEHI